MGCPARDARAGDPGFRTCQSSCAGLMSTGGCPQMLVRAPWQWPAGERCTKYPQPVSSPAFGRIRHRRRHAAQRAPHPDHPHRQPAAACRADAALCPKAARRAGRGAGDRGRRTRGRACGRGEADRGRHRHHQRRRADTRIVRALSATSPHGAGRNERQAAVRGYRCLSLVPARSQGADGRRGGGVQPRPPAEDDRCGGARRSLDRAARVRRVSRGYRPARRTFRRAVPHRTFARHLRGHRAERAL